MAKPYTLKKGDRVVVVNASVANGPWSFLEMGDTGTLTENDHDAVPYIKWDGKLWEAGEPNGDFAAIVYGLEKINE